MNDLFAVAPNAHRDSFELRSLLDRLGPYLGRYVTKLPSDWEKAFYDYCDTLPAIDGLRCKQYFQRRKNTFIPANRSWNRGQSWTKNVQVLVEKGESFTGVIGEPEVSGPFSTLRDFDWDAIRDSKDRDVKCSAEEYGDAASVLIRSNPRIILVDPYFRPQDKTCNAVLREFCSVGKGSRFARLELIVREAILCEKKDLNGILKDAQKLLSGIDAPSMGVWLIPVDDSLSLRPMHERYLLAESGALEFGYGFKEFYDGRSTRLSVVGREFHQLLVSLYYDECHDFARPVGVPPRGIRIC